MSPNNALAISIVSAISGSLSIMGSTAIIYNVLYRNAKTRLSSTYHRLMFTMSIMDIISSGNASLSTIPAPSNTPNVYAFGNTATCVAQGFISTIGGSVIFYNFFLTVHFLMSICTKVDKHTMRQKVEPVFHFIALGYPFCTGLAGLYLDVYNFHGPGCWASPYPTGCIENDDVECTRGIHAYAFQWISIGYFLAFAMIAIPSMVIYITWHVWICERKINKKYGHTSTNEENDSKRVLCWCFRRNSISRLQDENITQVRVFTRTKAVARQCGLYVLAFMMTYIWSFLNGAVKQAAGQSSGTLQILDATFYSLQGFFNYLVFIKRLVMSLRARYPEYSLLKVFALVTFHPAQIDCLIKRHSTRFTTIRQEKTRCSIRCSIPKSDCNDIEMVEEWDNDDRQSVVINEDPECNASDNQDMAVEDDAEDKTCHMESYSTSNKHDGSHLHKELIKGICNVDDEDTSNEDDVYQFHKEVIKDVSSVGDQDECKAVAIKSLRIEDFDITCNLDDHGEVSQGDGGLWH